MATVFQDDIEGIALGTVPATAQWDEITGVPAVVNTRARSGSKSVEFDTALGVQTVSQLFASPVTTRYMRRAVFVVGRPTAAGPITIMRVRTAAAVSVAEVRLNNAGNIILRDGATTVATSTAVVPLSTWFGVTWGITGTTQTLRYYANPANDTVTETLTGAYAGGAFARVVDGCGNALNNTYLMGFDDWLDDDTTWPTVVVAPYVDTGLRSYALRGGAYVQLTSRRLVNGVWV